mmetsp:Transcript_7581/g.25788  ORF Transcript_7581/g.25788 Transcript_7581/m.25788 type:complete len:250 (+) Transcript_7581:81-830(+)
MSNYQRLTCACCGLVVWRPVETSEEPGAEQPVAPATPVCGKCRQFGTPPVVGKCGVCLENTGLILKQKATSSCCGHRFCHGCWTTYVLTSVESGTLFIKCMQPGCGETFTEAGLRRFAGDKYATYVQNKHAAHSDRLKELLAAGGPTGEWVRTNVQACPRCHVLVQRSDGCNHIKCRCGHDFCYRCGQSTSADCNCPYAADGPRLRVDADTQEHVQRELAHAREQRAALTLTRRAKALLATRVLPEPIS